MDLLQRFRPATYWAVLARRIEKMTKAGVAGAGVGDATASSTSSRERGTHTPCRRLWTV